MLAAAWTTQSSTLLGHADRSSMMPLFLGLPLAIAAGPSSGLQTATPSRFTIVSHCSFDIWIQQQYGEHGLPIPGNPNAKKLSKGESQAYTIPDEGLAGSRFWAKTGCDASGYNCRIGDQVPDPAGKCPPQGCTPPVDSLFEATWGCTLSNPQSCAGYPSAPAQHLGSTTYFDTSQVDGYTLPYRVDFEGDTTHCDCDPSGHCKGTTHVDASRLSLDRCPTNDDLSEGGRFSHYVKTDLRLRVDNETVACMSPCKRLSSGHPYGPAISERTEPALHMCCPTPIIGAGCTEAAGCMSPDACRNTSDVASVTRTKYVHAIHAMAPGIYSYTYDDGMGLHSCPGTVTYTMTFCPATGPQPPSPPPSPPTPPQPPSPPMPPPSPAGGCPQCTPVECKSEQCAPDAFVCTAGAAAGGCAGTASAWNGTDACTACCDTSSCTSIIEATLL